MLTTALSKPRFVFISYAEEDTKHADELINKLNSHSIDTWAAYKNIKPGDIWDASIETAVSKASALCVLASKNSVASSYVRAEVEKAITAEKTVIPICIDDCELPLRWSTHQYICWRTEGEGNVPLRKTGNDYFTPGSEDLSNVISSLSEILPTCTRSEFLRLLESPDEEDNLRSLIKTFYEWVPDPEINMGRSYEKHKWGKVQFDKMAAGELIDITVVGEDSGGTKSTYVYLGCVHQPPALADGSMSSAFSELVERVKKQLPEIYDADGTHIIIIYGRRAHWDTVANSIRRKLEDELFRGHPRSHCTVMSYDRLIEK